MPIEERRELASSDATMDVISFGDPGILPGSVCVQYVRCGKDSCSCRAGRLHGPYHYRVWRAGSTVKKAYVKPEDVPAVVAACEAYAAFSRALRELRHEREKLTHTLEKDLKKARRVLTDHRSPHRSR